MWWMFCVRLQTWTSSFFVRGFVDDYGRDDVKVIKSPKWVLNWSNWWVQEKDWQDGIEIRYGWISSIRKPGLQDMICWTLSTTPVKAKKMSSLRASDIIICEYVPSGWVATVHSLLLISIFSNIVIRLRPIFLGGEKMVGSPKWRNWMTKMVRTIDFDFRPFTTWISTARLCKKSLKYTLDYQMSILRINRQVYQEASAIFQRENCSISILVGGVER